MNKRQTARVASLLPGGVPRKIRIYDNCGETADRYTVVFTGNYRAKTGGCFWYLGLSGAPFHPQGIGCTGEHDRQIDRPTYGHLGKRVKWESLPDDCKRATLNVYCDLWDLRLPENAPVPSITVAA